MNNQSSYISLQKATKYCNYSQEYLSLRARQGKLKAIKIGRNWITKKEWIEEYAKNVNNGNNQEIKKIPKSRVIEPPENLPVETSERKFSIPIIEQPVPKLRLRFAIVLVFILLITGGIFIFQQNQVGDSFYNVGYRISYRISNEGIRALSEDIVLTMADMSSKEVRASTIDTFQEYSQWLKSQIPKVKIAYFAADDFVKKKLAQGYQIITTPFIKVYQLVFSPLQKPEIKEKSEKILETKEGMVIISSTEEDKEIKKKIKEAFSDEIRVEPKDESSGIIIPIFREREGEEYLYIMVPMKN